MNISTGASSERGTAYPSGAPELTPPPPWTFVVFVQWFEVQAREVVVCFIGGIVDQFSRRVEV